MTNAIIGYDTLYEIEDGESPAAFQAVAEVISITPPNEQVNDVNATHMKSPNRTMEYIAGMIEPGDCSLEINWIPNDTTGAFLLGLKNSGATRQHRITWPNGVTWTFSAYVKGFEPQSPIDDRMTATVTCKVAGSVLEAPAAGG